MSEARAGGGVLVQAWSDFGVPMDPGDLEKEKEECKREIREIRKLVHPDILMNNPVYAKLNEEQKKNERSLELEDQPSELAIPQVFAYHDMRSLEGLRQVRRKVEAILKMNNIQVNLQYQIQGETIHEQIAWLDDEINLLETGSMLLKAVGRHAGRQGRKIQKSAAQ